MAALPGSGWCERAERLISDRIDGALPERDEPRLDVHLRNCPRCVEHERRLVQATDALVAGVVAPAAPRRSSRSRPRSRPSSRGPRPNAARSGRPPRAELARAVGWSVLIVAAFVLALAALAIALAAQL